MKWSWKIARVADIEVYLHVTFVILILWIALGYWQLEGTLAAVINGVAFILALFFCVVLHEFGHALTARRFGIPSRQGLHVVAARKVDGVDFAGQQLREAEGAEPDDESVDRRFAPVVVWVGLELDLGTGQVAHPAERSVAHRALPILPAMELGRILALE